MSIQTTLTPINGKEAKQILDIEFKKILDQTPGLDLATSYHRITIEGKFRIIAYPADTKTPSREFVLSLDSPQTKNGNNEDHFAKIKYLETIRAELVEKLNRVTQELDNINPIIEASFELKAENTPDNLRIQEKLPIPIVEKIGGRNVEGYKDVDWNKGQLQFGKEK